MLAVVKSVSLHGLEGSIISVEVDVSNGLPVFEVVGLPDSAVREARERVRAAIKNSGFDFPVKRITVNLAPADLKKEGAVFDLAIAVGILAATGQCSISKINTGIFLGELSLDGTVRPVSGVLPSCMVAKESLPGPVFIYLPTENSSEGALIKGVEIIPTSDLKKAVDLIDNPIPGPHHLVNFHDLLSAMETDNEDYSEVKGHVMAKRALEIAAAGGHNLIMIGPPGSGKTMLAKRFTGILPPLSEEEALEITKIYSVAGLLKNGNPLISKRPFRSPHHNASPASLVGGGRIPKPGEISLAHHGVLFLDEMPEFSKSSLESLRQPIEDGEISVARVNATLSYPAKLILLATMNPCPCGYFGDNKRECSCTPLQIKKYVSRISGPLLDRIDIHIEVPKLKYEHLMDNELQETSEEISSRVLRARLVQASRYGISTKLNANLSTKEIRFFCKMSPTASLLMKSAFNNLELSARAYNKILKIARTIADLEGSAGIEKHHVAEAIQYRSLDRKYWG